MKAQINYNIIPDDVMELNGLRENFRDSLNELAMFEIQLDELLRYDHTVSNRLPHETDDEFYSRMYQIIKTPSPLPEPPFTDYKQITFSNSELQKALDNKNNKGDK